MHIQTRFVLQIKGNGVTKHCPVTPLTEAVII
jgi:hypothetical protein